MPGKLCTGTVQNNAGAGALSQSKAYCEGMQYRQGGTASGQTVDDNPFLLGSPDSDSWIAGWDVAEANVGIMPREVMGCCGINSTIYP